MEILIFMSWKPMDTIALGGIIAAIGALIAVFGTRQHNKSSSEKTTSIKLTGEQAFKLIKDIEGLNKINNELTAKIDKVVQRNTALSEENIKLTTAARDVIQSVEKTSNDLARTSEELNNQVTGGNSFPVIDAKVTIDANSHRIASISLYKIGTYPLTNIRIEYNENRYYSQELLDKGEITDKKSYELSQEKHVKNIEFLGAYPIYDVISVPLYSKGPEFPGADFMVRVYWRDTWYLYNLEFSQPIKNGYMIIKKEYLYKEKAYLSSEEFIKAMKHD